MPKAALRASPFSPPRPFGEADVTETQHFGPEVVDGPLPSIHEFDEWMQLFWKFGRKWGRRVVGHFR